MAASALLELKDITKKFPGVTALNKVTMSLKKGEFRALVGENGAGKSTVAKVIAGLYSQTEGKMSLYGKPYSPKGIPDAHSKGVSILYQEPSLEPYISVGENIFLGSLSLFSRFFCVDWKKLHRAASELLKGIGAADIDVRMLISGLTVGQKKLVELARALSYEPELLLVDETTAALNRVEVDLLFDNLERIRARGTGVLYISHRLEEVFELCDTVTVLRDGELVKTLETSETNIDELSSLMVGREIDLSTYYRSNNQRDFSQHKPVLEVRGLTSQGRFEDISFMLNGGEILGVAGLIGSGSENVLEALFGVCSINGGQILVDGQEARIYEPAEAIENGLAYVPKERDEEGLIPLFSVKENVCMVVLSNLMKSIVLNRRGMQSLAAEYRDKLAIKSPSIETTCVALSGGNRQKVVLAKWLASKPRVLLLNNPTRGVDVGAKREVYKLINQLAQEGLGVIIASDELPELLGLSDRLLVMRKGQISQVFSRHANWNEEEVISWMI